MDKFVCNKCGKEQNTYPRSIAKDGKITCWKCENLKCFNDYDEIFSELKEEIKKYMLESPYTPNSIAIFIINDLVEFLKNREYIDDFNTKFNHLKVELEILKK